MDRGGKNQMKIKIELLSDLCTCSGETYNSMVDMDVVYDENGIPYIPAKRLKGCIRESALEMQELGIITQEEYEKIFGREGNVRSAFSLSNAYILGFDEAVEDLKNCTYKDLLSPQNVLNQYTYIRTQTAVNLKTGVAEDSSLRTIRVVKKGLKFEAECNWNKGSQKVEKGQEEILKQAVSLVKHIGVSRTRGLGLVEMSLHEEEQKQAEHVLIKKEKLAEHNKIHYQIDLKSPIICKSPKGNQAQTQDYIAGSKVLGLIAGAIGKEEYLELLAMDDEIIVSNAYITNGRNRGVPARLSWQKEKDQPYDVDGNMKLVDMLDVEKVDIENKQMTPSKIAYVDENRTILSVETEISYHHQRPKDKSIGRATGQEDGSSFYQLASICAGQSFSGYIYANKEQAEKIVDAVSGLRNVRMGYGRSSEFGAVDFILDSVTEVKPLEEFKINDAVMTLLSDVILYNENGMLTTDIKVLKKYLEEIAGVDDFEIKNPYLQFDTIGGFNVTWKARKPIFNVIGKGSTFLVHSSKGFDVNLFENRFVGERVSEGYGEIKVEEKLNEKFSTVIVQKKKVEVQKKENLQNEKTGIINTLLESEFERRLQKAVREELENEQKAYESKADILNAAVSKLRMIFKNENSYEAIKEQVDGIENDAKNTLCKDLIKLIVPDEIARTIQTEMKNDYNLKYPIEWEKERLYRVVYSAYLTELKYFTKILQKKGENE